MGLSVINSAIAGASNTPLPSVSNPSNFFLSFSNIQIYDQNSAVPGYYRFDLSKIDLKRMMSEPSETLVGKVFDWFVEKTIAVFKTDTLLEEKESTQQTASRIRQVTLELTELNSSKLTKSVVKARDDEGIYIISSQDVLQSDFSVSYPAESIEENYTPSYSVYVEHENVIEQQDKTLNTIVGVVGVVASISSLAIIVLKIVRGRGNREAPVQMTPNYATVSDDDNDEPEDLPEV